MEKAEEELRAAETAAMHHESEFQELVLLYNLFTWAEGVWVIFSRKVKASPIWFS